MAVVTPLVSTDGKRILGPACHPLDRFRGMPMPPSSVICVPTDIDGVHCCVSSCVRRFGRGISIHASRHAILGFSLRKCPTVRLPMRFSKEMIRFEVCTNMLYLLKRISAYIMLSRQYEMWLLSSGLLDFLNARKI